MTVRCGVVVLPITQNLHGNMGPSMTRKFYLSVNFMPCKKENIKNALWWMQVIAAQSVHVGHFVFFKMTKMTKSFIEHKHWIKPNILMHNIKTLAIIPEPRKTRSNLTLAWKNGNEKLKSNWESLLGQQKFSVWTTCSFNWCSLYNLILLVRTHFLLHAIASTRVWRTSIILFDWHLPVIVTNVVSYHFCLFYDPKDLSIW